MPTNSHWLHTKAILSQKTPFWKNYKWRFFFLFWSKNNHYFLHIFPLWLIIHTLFFFHALFIYLFVYEGGQHLEYLKFLKQLLCSIFRFWVEMHAWLSMYSLAVEASVLVGAILIHVASISEKRLNLKPVCY